MSKSGRNSLLFGVFKQITIALGVTLYLGEIYAMLLVLQKPLHFLRASFKTPLRPILLIFGLYFLSQVVSNWVINEVVAGDAFRGMANTAMAVLLLIFLTKTFAARPRAILWLLAGEGISFILSYFLRDFSDVGITHFYRQIACPAVNNFVLLMGYYLLHKNAPKAYITLLFSVYGMLNIYLDARWYGLSFIIVGVGVALKDFLVQMSLKKGIIIALVFILGAQVFFTSYVYLMRRGYLNNPRIERQLTLVDDPYNPLHVLKIGRAETYTALKAITNRPLLGYGDWARDPEGVYFKDYLRLRGYEDVIKEYPDYVLGKTIPNHSVIFGAWLYSGILGFISIGALCLIFVIKSLRMLKGQSITANPLQLIVLYFLINGIWVFFFSPIQHLRHTVAVYLAFVLALQLKDKQQKLDMMAKS